MPTNSFLTIDDYRRTNRPYTDEGGAVIAPSVDEATWNSWSDEEKWMNLGQGFSITPDDPRYAALAQQTGARNGEHIRILWAAGRSPEEVKSGPDTMFMDPSRVARLGNDGLAYIEPNLTPEARSHEGDNVNSDFEHFVRNAVTLGSLYVGAGTAGWLGADPATGAAATGATGSTTIPGTDGVAGTEIVNTYAPGANPADYYVPGGTGTPIPTPAPMPTPTPTPEPGPGWTTEGGTPPLGTTQPGSYVPGQQAPVTGTTAPPAPQSTGVINNLWNGAQRVGEWYNNLTPAARYVVNQGVGMGVQGLVGANAQRAASNANDEAEQRAREDRERRGQVQPFGAGTFTPKPKTGIINSRIAK